MHRRRYKTPHCGSTNAPTSKAATTGQEFSLANLDGCVTDGTTVNPADTVCVVSISFTPRYPGLRTGALELTANSTAISLGLYGEGLGPEAIVIPGTIRTILDRANASGGDVLTAPQRMALDPAGNLYVADRASNVVWSLHNQVGASPTIIAGGGALAPAQANGAAATDAFMEQPSAVALDAGGNLYIADTGANLVRKVNLATGIISNVAGTGTSGYSGDKGLAADANLDAPAGVAANAVGDLFIADTGNNVIRRVYCSRRNRRNRCGDRQPRLFGRWRRCDECAIEPSPKCGAGCSRKNVCRRLRKQCHSRHRPSHAIDRNDRWKWHCRIQRRW